MKKRNQQIQTLLCWTHIVINFFLNLPAQDSAILNINQLWKVIFPFPTTTCMSYGREITDIFCFSSSILAEHIIIPCPTRSQLMASTSSTGPKEQLLSPEAGCFCAALPHGGIDKPQKHKNSFFFWHLQSRDTRSTEQTTGNSKTQKSAAWCSITIICHHNVLDTIPYLLYPMYTKT